MRLAAERVKQARERREISALTKAEAPAAPEMAQKTIEAAAQSVAQSMKLVPHSEAPPPEGQPLRRAINQPEVPSQQAVSSEAANVTHPTDFSQPVNRLQPVHPMNASQPVDASQLNAAIDVQRPSNGTDAVSGSACDSFNPDEWYSQIRNNWAAYMGEEEGTDYKQTYRWLDTFKGLGGSFDFVIDAGAHAGTFSDKVRWRFPYAAFVLIDADPVLVNNWLIPGYAHVPDTLVLARALDNTRGLQVQLLGDGGVMNASSSGPSPYEQLQTSKLDDIIPEQLNEALHQRWAASQSVFLKVDTEGMDELILRGFDSVLKRRHGHGVVNIIQLEFSPSQMRDVNTNVTSYNLETTTKFLEKNGFMVFWIGPNFVPLTHGAWNDKYLDLAQAPTESLLGPNMAGRRMATDLLAVRDDHPLLKRLMLLLGSCAPKGHEARVARRNEKTASL